MGLKTNSATMISKKMVEFLITTLHSSAFTSCDFQKHEQPHYIKNRNDEQLKGPKENDMLEQTTNQLPAHMMLSNEVFAVMSVCSCELVELKLESTQFHAYFM